MREIEVCIISPGTRIQGTLEITDTARFHGKLKGEIRGAPGSQVTLSEESSVEGEVVGDLIIVEGFVEGTITASRILVRGTARIRGKLQSANLHIEPGALVEAQVIRSR